MKKSAFSVMLVAMFALTACSGGSGPAAPLGGALDGAWVWEDGPEQRTLTFHGSNFIDLAASNHQWIYFSHSNSWQRDNDTYEPGNPYELGVHVCGTDGLPACDVRGMIIAVPVGIASPAADTRRYCLFREETSLSGTFSVAGNQIEFMHSNGDIMASEFTYADDTITVRGYRYTRAQ